MADEDEWNEEEESGFFTGMDSTVTLSKRARARQIAENENSQCAQGNSTLSLEESRAKARSSIKERLAAHAAKEKKGSKKKKIGAAQRQQMKENRKEQRRADTAAAPTPAKFKVKARPAKSKSARKRR